MTTGRINQVASICDADAAAHPSERRATAGRPSIVFERRWCEDEHTAHVHRIHEARAVLLPTVRRPGAGLPEPEAVQEATQRARRSRSQLQRHGRDNRHS